MNAALFPGKILDAYRIGEALVAARAAVPEIFDRDGQLVVPGAARGAKWAGSAMVHSPVDGGFLGSVRQMSQAQAASTVEAADAQSASWAATPLHKRTKLVAEALRLVVEHEHIITVILAWEIGKTPKAAQADLGRALSGAQWYIENIGEMMQDRSPIGVVSNIASWNYPFSVLFLNMLVQALSGNASVAKTPHQGGGISLSLAVALARRAGLPLFLTAGRGAELGAPLIDGPGVAGVAFVGGRENGAAVASRLARTDKRYALEMEGINSYVVTDFSNWPLLKQQIRSGFDFGKQRCTAYTRWVVEQSLVPDFVDAYIEAVVDLRVGHPFLGTPVDFGPLISAAKVTELGARVAEATASGATTVFEKAFPDGAFLPRQDRSAYMMPRLVVGAKPETSLYQREPFGPVDLLVPVSSTEAMLDAANASGGALVASVASDSPARVREVAARLQAYKVGVNGMKSRGDRDEPFGGLGGSWLGAYVGGKNLVYAFTDGPQPVEGNYPAAATSEMA